MRYDVNLSILFTELPLLERPAAARAAGFEAVELWWPFPVPVPEDREIVEVMVEREANAAMGASLDAIKEFEPTPELLPLSAQ